jgi:hypothetical protein
VAEYDFTTVDEFLALCDTKPSPKLVKCYGCGKWIREGERYVSSWLGQFHLDCKETMP